MTMIGQYAFLMSGYGVDIDAIIDDALNPKQDESIEWYNNLCLNTKINVKELAIDICGMEFKDMIRVLGFRTSIKTIYEKLKIEGIL